MIVATVSAQTPMSWTSTSLLKISICQHQPASGIHQQRLKIVELTSMDIKQATVSMTLRSTENSLLESGLVSVTTTQPSSPCVKYQSGKDKTESMNFTELRTLADGPCQLARALLSFLAPHAMSLSSMLLMSSSTQLLEVNMTAAGHTSPSPFKMTLSLQKPLQLYMSTVSTRDKSSPNTLSSPTEMLNSILDPPSV